MKRLSLLVATGLLLLTSCQYDIPLALDHTIPVEEAILGTWVIVAGENDDPATQLRIHRFSDTEYTVHYQESSLDLYFRAYDVLIEGVSATQLELIGSGEGAIGKADEDRYVVAKYRLVNGQLEVKTLNTDLIADDIKTSDTLRQVFITQKDHPDLFNDPGYFRRSGD